MHRCRVPVITPALLLASSFASGTLGQVTTEDEKFFPASLADEANFGAAIDIEGDVAVIGAYLDDGAPGGGAVYVYRFVDGGWAFEQKLTGPSGSSSVGRQFGRAVDLSGDRIVIGAPAGSGRAYVYAYDGAGWFREATLTKIGATPGDWFGGAVAIAGDLIVVGADNDSDDGFQSGAAYIYERTDTDGWVQQPKIVLGGVRTGDGFGSAVGIVGDRVLVGAPRTDDGGFDNGSVTVLEDDGSGWAPTDQFQHPNPTSDRWFGDAIASDGTRAVIGAPRDAGSGGSVVIYTATPNGLVEEDALFDPDRRDGTFFGRSVAILGDHLVVGSIEVNAGDSGSARLFAFNGASWDLAATLRPSDGVEDDAFGRGVGLSTRGVLVGASDSETVGPTSGAAYWFSLAEPCLPDVNGDGTLDAADFSAWITAFNTGSARCDQNGDGACTPADFSAWILNFNRGCG